MNKTMTSRAGRLGNIEPSDGRSSETKPSGKKQIVCPVMIDFLKSRNTCDGFGMFEGIPEAVEFSSQITRNQMNRLKRGKVPAAFWDFLKQIKIIPRNEAMPDGGMTLGALACRLQDPSCTYPSETERSMAQFIARQMLKASNPDLSDASFASGVWQGWERRWIYRTAEGRK